MRHLIELITHGLRLRLFGSLQRVIYVLITGKRIESFINIPYSINSDLDHHQSTIACTPLVIMKLVYQQSHLHFQLFTTNYKTEEKKMFFNRFIEGFVT